MFVASMPVDFPVTVEGVVDAMGTLELLHAPKLPAGPVRARLEALNDETFSERAEPGGMIPAPFDLPLPQPGVPVTARAVAEFLPPPFELSESDLAPE
jgi:hypothetical protein